MYQTVYEGKTFAGELAVDGLVDWDSHYQSVDIGIPFTNSAGDVIFRNRALTGKISLTGILQKDLKDRDPRVVGSERFSDGADIRTSYLEGMVWDSETNTMIALTRNSAYAMIDGNVGEVMVMHGTLNDMWNNAMRKKEK